MSIRIQIIRYGSVGLMNTAVTFAVIAVLTYAGQHAAVANAAGFAAGLANSFFMNRHYTFAVRSGRREILPFLMAFLVAYGSNIALLYASLNLASVSELLPQIIGMITYNVVFFFLMRSWVFRDA